MKKIFLAIIALAISFSALAQEAVSKQVVNVLGFSSTNDFREDEITIVRNNVINSLQETKRILVVDLRHQSSIDFERERRKSENALGDNHDVADMTQLNANYILKGNLNSVTIEHKTGTNVLTTLPYDHYIAVVNYTISVIDPATGATMNVFTYNSKATEKSSDDARAKAILGSGANLKQFIEEAFPIRGTIVQIQDKDDKAVKSVYINLGNNHGIQKGQKFTVFAVIQIAGEKAEKEVGTITCVELLGATRSLCKVNDGGKKMLTHSADGGQFEIQSKARK